jgi:hypothetical protein
VSVTLPPIIATVEPPPIFDITGPAKLVGGVPVDDCTLVAEEPTELEDEVLVDCVAEEPAEPEDGVPSDDCAVEVETG